VGWADNLAPRRDVCTDQTTRSQEAYPLSKQISTQHRPSEQIQRDPPFKRKQVCKMILERG
jgi:hypothetical protein